MSDEQQGALSADDWRRLVQVVAEAMRSEVMRGITPPEQLPPPSDLAAEDLLVSAVLGAEVDPNALTVEAEDFYSPLAGAVYGLASVLYGQGARVSVEPILMALRDQGFTGPVECELLRWRDEVPSVSTDLLIRKSERVRELASRRLLIAYLHRIDAQLHTDATDYATAADDLINWLAPPDGGDIDD